MYYYNSHLEDMSEKYIFACFTKFQCLKFHQHYILVSLLVTHAISEVSEAKSHEEVNVLFYVIFDVHLVACFNV